MDICQAAVAIECAARAASRAAEREYHDPEAAEIAVRQVLAERLGPLGAPSEATDAMARKTSRELASSQRKAWEIERIIMEELVVAGERQDEDESGRQKPESSDRNR